MINQQNPVGSQRTVQSSKNKWKLCWRLTTLWLSCSVNPRTEYWIKKTPELHGIKHHCGINSLCLFKNCVRLPAKKKSDTGPNQVSSVPNISAFRQIKYHLLSPCQLTITSRHKHHLIRFSKFNRKVIICHRLIWIKFALHHPAECISISNVR